MPVNTVVGQSGMPTKMHVLGTEKPGVPRIRAMALVSSEFTWRSSKRWWCNGRSGGGAMVEAVVVVVVVVAEV
jgi:hypothetical protein